MEIYVVISVYKGVMNDAKGFLTDKAATEYEKKLCEENDIPFDWEKRREIGELDLDIYHYRFTFIDGEVGAVGEEC